MASTDRSLSDRLFAVRSALGTTRKPLPFQALATLVEQHTGERVSWESLRRYEADGREPPLWIIRALAEIDPLEDTWWRLPMPGTPGECSGRLPATRRPAGEWNSQTVFACST